MERRHRIIIVDDHPLFREGLKLLIEKEKIGHVIGLAENGEVFLDILKTSDPDLVLMDIEMPVMNGFEATIKALKIRPDLKVLVLTIADQPQRCIDMIRAGAMGFVQKTTDKKILEKAIETVAEGNSFYTMDIIHMLASQSNSYDQEFHSPANPQIEFSDRELEVLRYFSKGLSAPEIAERLLKSVRTVEFHRSRLFEKTNTKNTLNLVLYAIKNKLVEI
jgi:DNA-binding NarL/FixJ family response regulator